MLTLEEFATFEDFLSSRTDNIDTMMPVDTITTRKISLANNNKYETSTLLKMNTCAEEDRGPAYNGVLADNKIRLLKNP